MPETFWAQFKSKLENFSDDLRLLRNPYHGQEDELLSSATKAYKQARNTGADLEALKKLAKKIESIKNYIEIRDAHHWRQQFRQSDRLTAAVNRGAAKYQNIDIDFRVATPKERFKNLLKESDAMLGSPGFMGDIRAMGLRNFKRKRVDLEVTRELIGREMMDKFIQSLKENRAVKNLKQAFLGRIENEKLVGKINMSGSFQRLEDVMSNTNPGHTGVMMRAPYMNDSHGYTAETTKSLKLCRIQTTAAKVDGSWFFPCGMLKLLPRDALHDFLAVPNFGRMKVVEVSLPPGTQMEISVAGPVAKSLATKVDKQFGGPQIGGGGIGGGVQIRVPDYSKAVILDRYPEP